MEGLRKGVRILKTVQLDLETTKDEDKHCMFHSET
jgi:hypothetical protein